MKRFFVIAIAASFALAGYSFVSPSTAADVLACGGSKPKPKPSEGDAQKPDKPNDSGKPKPKKPKKPPVV